MNDEQIKIGDDSLHTLIKSYCRESGVRNLQKHIEKVILINQATFLCLVCLYLPVVGCCASNPVASFLVLVG